MSSFGMNTRTRHSSIASSMMLFLSVSSECLDRSWDEDQWREVFLTQYAATFASHASDLWRVLYIFQQNSILHGRTPNFLEHSSSLHQTCGPNIQFWTQLTIKFGGNASAAVSDGSSLSAWIKWSCVWSMAWDKASSFIYAVHKWRKRLRASRPIIASKYSTFQHNLTQERSHNCDC